MMTKFHDIPVSGCRERGPAPNRSLFKAAGQNLEGLQAEVGAGPDHFRRAYTHLVQHVDVSRILKHDISLT